MEKYLKIDEYTSLRYSEDLVENAKAVIIINHGFAEHMGRYEYIKNKLNYLGYSVYRYDLRGHGKSRSERGHIDSYKELITDCDKIVELAKKDNPNKEIFMLGHSMGGLVTGMYGITYPDKLVGQIFSGPAVGTLPQVSGIKSYVLKFLSRIVPNKRIKNLVEDKICSVESVVEEYKNDPLVLKDATIKFYNEFLIESINFINKNIKNYTYPCLILHGEEDKIVPVKIGKNFYENISSKDKEFISYENLYHEILNEDRKDEIIDTIDNWILRHI